MAGTEPRYPDGIELPAPDETRIIASMPRESEIAARRYGRNRIPETEPTAVMQVRGSR